MNIIEKVARALHSLPNDPWAGVSFDDLPKDATDRLRAQAVLAIDVLRDENLRALCQRCHLRYDAKHHAKNAARTRRTLKRNGELF